MKGLNEQEQQQNAAYEWVLHDAGVQAKYAGMFVAAHGQRVLGAGMTRREVLEAALAQPDCPPRATIALVYVEGQPLNGPWPRGE